MRSASTKPYKVAAHLRLPSPTASVNQGRVNQEGLAVWGGDGSTAGLAGNGAATAGVAAGGVAPATPVPGKEAGDASEGTEESLAASLPEVCSARARPAAPARANTTATKNQSFLASAVVRSFMLGDLRGKNSGSARTKTCLRMCLAVLSARGSGFLRPMCGCAGASRRRHRVCVRCVGAYGEMSAQAPISGSIERVKAKVAKNCGCIGHLQGDTVQQTHECSVAPRGKA